RVLRQGFWHIYHVYGLDDCRTFLGYRVRSAGSVDSASHDYPACDMVLPIHQPDHRVAKGKEISRLYNADCVQRRRGRHADSTVGLFRRLYVNGLQPAQCQRWGTEYSMKLLSTFLLLSFICFAQANNVGVVTTLPSASTGVTGFIFVWTQATIPFTCP